MREITKFEFIGVGMSEHAIYKRGCGKRMYMTQEGLVQKELFAWLARRQWKDKKILTDKVGYKMRIYFPDKRRRDMDNYKRILFDALIGIVYNDDSQIIEECTKKFIDQAYPRIELDIYEIKFTY